MKDQTIITLGLVGALLMLSTGAIAGTIGLAWDAVTHPDLVGYRVYYGQAAGTYNQMFDTGLTPEVTLLVEDCLPYWVAVKARGSDGSVSADYSAEISGMGRPKVESTEPNAVPINTQMDISIFGANFANGATVQLSHPDITVNSVTVLGCYEIVANVTVASGAAFSDVDVEVINPDQVFGAGASLFSVVPPGMVPPGQVGRGDKK
jgi:hypothetical protein